MIFALGLLKSDIAGSFYECYHCHGSLTDVERQADGVEGASQEETKTGVPLREFSFSYHEVSLLW